MTLQIYTWHKGHPEIIANISAGFDSPIKNNHCGISSEDSAATNTV